MYAIEAKPIWQGRARVLLFPSISIVTLLSIFFILSNSFPHYTKTKPLAFNLRSSYDESMDNKILKIDISNEYTSKFGQIGQQYSWIQFPIVEPYRLTKIEVLKTDGTDVDQQGWEFMWIIDESDDVLSGKLIQFYFQDLNYHTITVYAVDKTTQKVIASSSQQVLSRYVRREIRSLIDHDREAFFDAVWVLHNTPLEEGRALYGDKFNDISSIVMFYNSRAGDINCDHMNDGFGSLSSHAALTLLFEKSLQTVNPIVTVPYWDYSIEGNILASDDYAIKQWRTSIIFSDDWLGELVPNDKILSSGRFAYTPVLSNAGNKTSIHNAYGLLRAPWNQNKIPYVTRTNLMYGDSIDSVPTCSDHYELLKIDTFDQYVRTSYQKDQLSIGGVWGADWLSYFTQFGIDINTSKKLIQSALTAQKKLYRMRILQCPQYCSLDTPDEDCKCTCPHLNNYVNDETQLSSLISKLYGDDINENYHRELLYLTCNYFDNLTPQIGDQLDSSSPNDISFWTIQPTKDRLFQWKIMNNGFESFDWKDNQAWSVHGVSNGYCYGHNLMDVIGFTNLFESNPGPYTNEQLLQMLSPMNDFSPYIYDSFSWEHCENKGFSPSLIG